LDRFIAVDERGLIESAGPSRTKLHASMELCPIRPQCGHANFAGGEISDGGLRPRAWSTRWAGAPAETEGLPILHKKTLKTLNAVCAIPASYAKLSSIKGGKDE
jgi:hypothetical protein